MDDKSPEPYTVEETENSPGGSHITVAMSVFAEFMLGLGPRGFAQYIMEICDKFDLVTLDFAGVEGIGQDFADEVFRVWQGQHPKTSIVIQNATTEIWDKIRAVTLGAS